MSLYANYTLWICRENVRHDSFYLYSNTFVHIIILAVQLASRDPIVITRNSYPWLLSSWTGNNQKSSYSRRNNRSNYDDDEIDSLYFIKTSSICTIFFRGHHKLHISETYTQSKQFFRYIMAHVAELGEILLIL